MNLSSPILKLLLLLTPTLSLGQKLPSLGGIGNIGQGGGSFAPDTAGIDSSRPAQANIVRIFPDRIWQQEQIAIEDTVRMGIRTLHVWDLTDTLQGYTQSLGQYGKPVAQWVNGASASLMETNGWRNPFFARRDPFVLSPTEDIRYFDTKTPYVNIAYMQGAKRLQAVSVTASANITPNLNLVVGHTRRKTAGTYALSQTENTTDHRNIYASLYYRSTNRRYHAFLTGVYNELWEDLFGGTLKTATSTESSTFEKNSSNRVLTDASWNDRIVQSAHTAHNYCLVGRPYTDSLPSRQRITLMADAGTEAMRWRYRARNLSGDVLDDLLVSPVPLYFDSSNINWNILTTSLYASTGAGYVWNAGIFRLQATAQLGYQQLQIVQDNGAPHFDSLSQTSTWQQVKGSLTIPKIRTSLYLNWYQAASKLLPFTSRLQAGGDVGFGRSLKLLARVQQVNANPSLFQRYGATPAGTSWRADSGLRNQQVAHLWAALRWSGVPRTLDSLTDVSQFVQAGAFLTRTDNLIGYTRKLEVRQAQTSQNLQWMGIEVSGRKRLGANWYSEAQLTLQQGITNVADSIWLASYARNLPQFWGKASFYHDNRSLSIAGILRAGVDLYFFAPHSPLAFDVMSGEFFPGDYKIKGYVRADAFFAAQISRTYVFFKVTHLNEGVGTWGYYTTPVWPMLERTLNFGVNWSFYD